MYPTSHWGRRNYTPRIPVSGEVQLWKKTDIELTLGWIFYLKWLRWLSHPHPLWADAGRVWASVLSLRKLREANGTTTGTLLWKAPSGGFWAERSCEPHDHSVLRHSETWLLPARFQRDGPAAVACASDGRTGRSHGDGERTSEKQSSQRHAGSGSVFQTCKHMHMHMHTHTHACTHSNGQQAVLLLNDNRLKPCVGTERSWQERGPTHRFSAVRGPLRVCPFPPFTWVP